MTMLIMTLLVTLSVAIMVQDYRTLHISAPLIYVFTVLSLLLTFLSPLPGLSFGAHCVGGAIAGVLAGGIRQYYLKFRKIDGLGEADVWILTCSGVLLGPMIFGFWLIVASIIGILLITLFAAVSGRDEHPDDEKKSVLPLTPTLLVSIFVFNILTRLEYIPSNQLPFL